MMHVPMRAVEENTTVRKVLSEMVTSIRTKSVSYAKVSHGMGVGQECKPFARRWRLSPLKTACFSVLVT